MFEPPLWSPHPLIRGGHLQTVFASLASSAPASPSDIRPSATRRIEVTVSEGDQIVLHRDDPSRKTGASSTGAPSMGAAIGSVLLVHGLTGCHQAYYMVRLANRFLSEGYRTYRMDMRGLGAARDLSRNLSHAGRSDDVVAALATIASCHPHDRIFAMGISLGGAQLLRAIGRIDGRVESGINESPPWRNRLQAIAAISPPIDLLRCSQNMQRRSTWFYNQYFIRNLMNRLPPKMAERADVQQRLAGPRPQSLWELDNEFTAPLSGFENAEHYYEQSSAHPVMGAIQVPTLILAAQDDPIVPIDCFQGPAATWDNPIQVSSPNTGGHVGFLGRGRRCLIDEKVPRFFREISPPAS